VSAGVPSIGRTGALKVSTYLADEVILATDAQARMEGGLPQFLATAAVSTGRDLLQRQLQSALGNSTFQQVWVRSNRATHAGLVAALRGDPTSLVTVSGNRLQLDTMPLVAASLDWAETSIPWLGNLPVRQFVPSGFGQVVLVSDRLPVIQTAVQLMDVSLVVMPTLALALVVAALTLATDPRRMLVALGFGIALTFVLARFAMDAAVGRALGSVDDPTTQAAIGSVVRGVTSDLIRLDELAVAVGLIVALCGLVACARSRPPLTPVAP
jgi:hypothetical protein